MAEYTYEINNLRIRTKDPRTGEVTDYVFDQSGNRIEEHLSNTADYYIWRNERHLAKDTLDGTFFYSTDHLGSTVLMTDSEGNSVWKAEATPFGDSVADSGDLEGIESLKYTGKDYDDDIRLYYFNARWYDAELGRFISEDPIRFGSNWYRYASGNPLKFVDPTGLFDYYNPHGDNDSASPSYEYDGTEDGEVYSRREEERLNRERIDSILMEKYVEFSEYYEKFGTGFNQIELLLWTYLDTGDSEFLDLMPKEYINSPLFDTAVQNALLIYYSDNPGETARRISQRLAVTSGITIGIGTGMSNMASANLHRLTNIQMEAGALRTAMNARNTTNSNLLSGNRAPLSDQFASSIAPASSFTKLEPGSNLRRGWVRDLAANMKANGWQGDPISVLEYQGNRYVLDGHHRVTAAREAGVSVPYQSIPVQELPRFGYPTLDSVLWAAAEAGGY